MRNISRRDFTRYAGALTLALAMGGVGASLSGCGGNGKAGGARPLSSDQYNKLDPRNAGNFTMALRLPGTEGGLLGVIDAAAGPFEVVARRQSMEVLPGKATDLLAYEVKTGDKAHLNPVFSIKRGATLAARLANVLEEPTIVHWHGLHVDWRNDGHPSYAIGNGATYEYRFTVQNRAGTYWYHPHPHGQTARQAYGGLAGLLIVEDEDELRLRERLDLRMGVTDIPLVIQDRLFDDRGNLVYPSSPMDAFQGVIGDVILVNGTPSPVLEVESRVYRFRVLNGSNARVLRLSLAKDGNRLPFYLIGTDGGLLAQRRQVEEVFVAPAERVDLLVDLRSMNAGDTVFLKSRSFDPMHMEMAGMGDMTTPQSGGHGGGHGGTGGNATQTATPTSRLPDGADFYLLKLTVRRRIAYDLSIPLELSSFTPIDTKAATPRAINLSASGMRWLINGVQFDQARELFRIRTGTVEIWEIANATLSMPHPMHLHGFQFQVLERRNSPAQVREGGVDEHGRTATDLGWKDTVLIWPGETVKIAIDFSHQFTGDQLYTFHCHNLEHEDGGMMINYRVV